MLGILFLLFNIVGGLLIIQFVRFKLNQIKEADSMQEALSFAANPYIYTIGSIVGIGALILFLVLPTEPLIADNKTIHVVLGIVTALSISLIWATYIRRLDIFEPERWLNIIVVFLLGSATTFLVFPIAAWINSLGFFLNGEILNDFLYCTIGIGIVEEFVKLIPLLIIMRFKKVVNEPFDYLLYASVSALGFAFVENSLYIENTAFQAINGRALMATVAHMTFSTVIGYAYMTAHWKPKRKGYFYIIGGFILASSMHGFYDFWLINFIAQQYAGLSYLFFLLTTHFWFTMKSRAINASYFFDPSIDIANDDLRFFLVKWLSATMVLSAILISLVHGRLMALEFIRGQFFAYGFFIYYLSFSFSKFKIAPNFMAICQVPFDAIIPQEPEGRIKKSVEEDLIE